MNDSTLRPGDNTVLLLEIRVAQLRRAARWAKTARAKQMMLSLADTYEEMAARHNEMHDAIRERGDGEEQGDG
jgi:hypothetical protein